MRRKQSNNNNTPWKLSSFCLLVVKMKPQIFRLHHFSSLICSPLMFTPTWVSTWGFLDCVSNQCLDSGKKSQSGFDFIYLPWDGCVVFLTLESFSIFMEYHSRPCSTGNLLLSPSYFTRQLERAKQENNDLHCLGKSLAGLHSAVYSFVIHTQ